jgi:predicted GNAT superfamily acetyltransferase
MGCRMSIHLKVLSDMEEMKEANHLIESVWGKGNGMTPYLLMAHSQVGGLILGGFDGSRLIGVSYSFPGRDQLGLFLYSHLLAVDSAYRGSNIGYDLKRFQAAKALEYGYSKIKWTFDPLESKNAYLNIHKLGATSHEYKVNFYGHMTDPLNYGSPTDRLLVNWSLDRDEKRNTVGELQDYYAVAKLEENNYLPFVNEWERLENQDRICIPIPTNMHDLKKKSMEISQNWRMVLRDILQFYFAKGFIVHGFNFQKNRSYQYYLLTIGGDQ